MIGAALILLAAVSPLPEQLPPTWSHWQSVRVVAPARAGTQAIVIPPSIYAKAQRSLGDLRVIDSSGRPVPFTIAITPPPEPEVWTGTVLTDRGFVAGRYSQAVADVGKQKNAYSALDIATTLPAFATHADVDASDDLRLWRTIRIGAPIYDYREDGLASHTQVTFPTSTARYLRVRVAGAKSFPITGISVAHLSDAAPETTHYAPSLTRPVSDLVAGTTTIGLQGLAEVPIGRIRVDALTPVFARDVDVQAADGDGTWSTAATATVRRVGVVDDRSIAFAQTQGTSWRIVIHNRSDLPLRGVSVDAFGVPRRLYFDARPGEQYRLIYGNPNAPEAAFDFAQTHSERVLRSAKEVGLSAPLVNANFITAADSRPWTDRNPWILWVALTIAVAGIGTLALRAMPGQQPHE